MTEGLPRRDVATYWMVCVCSVCELRKRGNTGPTFAEVVCLCLFHFYISIGAAMRAARRAAEAAEEAEEAAAEEEELLLGCI